MFYLLTGVAIWGYRTGSTAKKEEFKVTNKQRHKLFEKK